MNIFTAFVFLLGICGIFFLAYFSVRYLAVENCAKSGIVTIYPVTQYEKDIEKTVRRLVFTLIWENESVVNKLYLLDVNATEPTLQKCREICCENDYIQLVSIHQLEEILFSKGRID